MGVFHVAVEVARKDVAEFGGSVAVESLGWCISRVRWIKLDMKLLFLLLLLLRALPIVQAGFIS